MKNWLVLMSLGMALCRSAFGALLCFFKDWANNAYFGSRLQFLNFTKNLIISMPTRAKIHKGNPRGEWGQLSM
jgi:hypothetical protein